MLDNTFHWMGEMDQFSEQWLWLQAKVVDATGKMVPFGTPGELWIRGYLNMLGYWGEDDKTKEIFSPSHWVKTGWALNWLLHTSLYFNH